MSESRVAVLGATGHVGKVLTVGLARCDGIRVRAFARSADRLGAFLASEGLAGEVVASGFEAFADEVFDSIIDCTGISDPSRFGPHARDLLRVRHSFDDLATQYLEDHEGCRLVSMSSGAAYLSDFEEPASSGSEPCLRPDRLTSADAYGAVKAMSESCHRIAGDLPIVDLRLFGLFSPYLDLSGHYLLSDAMRALVSGTNLVTDESDVTRDYAHPDDLTALVQTVLAAPPVNGAFDVYGAEPASKFELLDALSARFGLRYEVRRAPEAVSMTGLKPCYYSTRHSAAALGYRPRFTTLECVLSVASAVWGERSR